MPYSNLSFMVSVLYRSLNNCYIMDYATNSGKYFLKNFEFSQVIVLKYCLNSIKNANVIFNKKRQKMNLQFLHLHFFINVSSLMSSWHALQ